MSATLIFERLFPTPLYVLETESDPLIAPLENAILRQKAEHPGLRRSNIGGWHSEPDFRVWSGEAGEMLIQRTVDLASSHTHDVRTSSAPVGWSVEAWANVNRESDFNQFHGHGGSYWSAVYYVRVNSGEGGELVLADPRYPMATMHAPRYRFIDMGPQEVAFVKPKNGTLVMFPSWLMHSVRPWSGEGVRISIALNLAAVPVSV